MKIVVQVPGKTSEFENLNNIYEEVDIDELDITKLACERIKNKYPCGVMDEENSTILKIEL